MTSGRNDPPSTQDIRRQLVAQSLGVGNPSRLGHTLPEHADPTRECAIEVSVEDIRPYEHNPRRVPNPKFEEIKESIRTGGLRAPLTVTREPGAAHFIVESGGNTRLRALQQLWAETRDLRYGRLTVLFRPWRGHGQVLSAHLTENEQRGDMSFWDKACGVAALKRQLETERDSVLSLRALEDALHLLGLSVNTATLGLYLFATERLSSLAKGYPGLSGLDVKTLQPRLNALKREAMAATQCSEDQVYARAFDPAFVTFVKQRRVTSPSQALNVQAVVEACRSAVNEVFGPLAPAESPLGASSVQTAHGSDAGADGALSARGESNVEVPAPRVEEPHLWRQAQELAQHTGLAISAPGSQTTRMSDLWTTVDDAAIESLTRATHRRAWRCLRALAEPDGASRHADDAQAIDESSLVAWMFSAEDPAAPAFRSLAQALALAKSPIAVPSRKRTSPGEP